MAVILGMAAIAAWAIGTDRAGYVITYGVSMNPVYHQDDLVFVIKSDSYRIGDIAAYREIPSGLEVLHRIVGGDATNGYILRGDNNPSEDAVYPTAHEIIGKAVWHVPHGGIWLKPLLSPTSFGMIGFLIVGGRAVSGRTRREMPRGRRKKKVKGMARQGGSWTAVAAAVKTLSRLSMPFRVLAAVVAMLALSSVALGVLGWMKPPLQRGVTPYVPPQSITFSYSATVPRSPAYDGTRVTSPDPIFRKLTERVDLKMHYEGQPGSIEASATLATGSGWHTTFPLTPSKAFTGKSVDATATLDLTALHKRAADAAKAIGMPAGDVSITVNARVRRGGTETLNAPLALQLTDLQLKLMGGADSLTFRDASAPAPPLVPREIGSVMTAGQARSVAVLLLLAAAVGAVAIAFGVRRKLPLHTRHEIERRFPHLLVPVEPMASPPGKPVVSVDNFPALVKLAERYGQMILTWRRPDADDFVVRDEGITYRYRIPLDEPVLQNIEHLNRPTGMRSHRRKANQEVS